MTKSTVNPVFRRPRSFALEFFNLEKALALPEFTVYGNYFGDSREVVHASGHLSNGKPLEMKISSEFFREMGWNTEMEYQVKPAKQPVGRPKSVATTARNVALYFASCWLEKQESAARTRPKSMAAQVADQWSSWGYEGVQNRAGDSIRKGKKTALEHSCGLLRVVPFDAKEKSVYFSLSIEDREANAFSIGLIERAKWAWREGDEKALKGPFIATEQH